MWVKKDISNSTKDPQSWLVGAVREAVGPSRLAEVIVAVIKLMKKITLSFSNTIVYHD